MTKNKLQISIHALNTLPTLLTLLFTSTPPPPPFHLLLLLIILALYLALAYLTKATAGFYPYDFLNPEIHSRGVVAAYCVGIAVGACVVFGVVWGGVRGRVWVVRRWGWDRGMKGGSRRGGGAVDGGIGEEGDGEAVELEEVDTGDGVGERGVGGGWKG